jgi:hypothetical protein
MSLFSLLALAFGMVAATADRVPRPAFALIAVSGSRASARRMQRRTAVRTVRYVEHPVLVHLGQRLAGPRLLPLRGSVAARAPGAGC